MIIKAIKYAAKKVIYFGSKNECLFCGAKFSGFRPCGFDFPVLKEKNVVGTGLRLAACPFCHSSDRERLVYLFLKRKTNVFNERIKLLHVAPENNLGRKLKECGNIDYLSADLNSPLAMEKMDITDIKYTDNSFDAVICNHVLEHIIDDAKAIRELYRVIKP